MQLNSDTDFQIRLITSQEIYAVPHVPLSVPTNIDNTGLNQLVNELLKGSNPNFSGPKDFDFLALGELVRVPLFEHLKGRDAVIEAIDVEYIERTPAPEPEDSILHDDWVSSIKACDKWILSGCYDNSVNVWTSHGKPVASLKQHSAVVKDVAWIDKSDPSKGFVSVGHDQIGIIWEWEEGTDQINPKIYLRGHERGIDSVAVSPNSTIIATGGWDTHLKLWLTSESDEPSSKKFKGNKDITVGYPEVTLAAHKETISSINWIDNNTVCTASMDRTIKFWDWQTKGLKNEIIDQKAILSASWSPLSNTLLTATANRHIRLYDPRSTEGSICKTVFTSHKLWVSSVIWSQYDEHLFLSGSYDSLVKLWDTRSPNAPLYNLEGHEGQVLCVDWSNNKYMMSGGSDNSIHIFKNKQTLP